MVDEGPLQHRQLPIPGVPFDGADRLAGKLAAGRMHVGLVSLVPSGLSTITAQLRHCATPQPNLVRVSQILAQKVVHRQFVAHLERPVKLALMVRLSVVTAALP